MAYVSIAIGVAATAIGSLIALRLRLNCHKHKFGQAMAQIQHAYDKVKSKDAAAMGRCLEAIETVVPCSGP